jgi:hypothetical protein
MFGLLLVLVLGFAALVVAAMLVMLAIMLAFG